MLGPSFAFAALGTVTTYSVFTLLVTQWRTKFRKDVNAFENEAATRSTDALLNLETVKTFTNEVHESLRYDDALRKMGDANLKVSNSLASLNFGQQAIFSVALTGLTLMGELCCEYICCLSLTFV